MRQDPRCPHCDGKVSATASWCMHCGRDFEAPANANGGGLPGQSVAPTATPDADAGQVSAGAPDQIEDLDDLLAVLDRSAETRKALVIAIAGATWFLLVSVATPGTGGAISLLAAVALGLYLRQYDSAAPILVRGAYGAALAVFLVRWVSVLVFVSGGGLPLLLDGGALFAIVGLVLAGRWLSNHLRSPTAVA